MILSGVLVLGLLAGPMDASDNDAPLPPADTYQRLLHLAQGYSCSPRRTCKMIASCEEAYWYLRNCSWGGALDRDNDGVPCETIC